MSEAAGAEPELHRADPAVRRTTLIALPLAALLLVLLWHGFEAYLHGLQMQSTEQMLDSSGQVQDAMVRVLLGGSALLLLLAGYWDRLARRIRAAGRYPFAHARLFHDMPVLRGEGATRYARRTGRNAWAALLLALLLLLGAVLLPGYFARLHPVLAQGHVVFHIVAKGHANSGAQQQQQQQP